MNVDDFNSEAHQQLWDAQQDALRNQQFGVALVQAIRTPPLAPIPRGFAATVATLVEGTRADDDRVERRLQTTLMLLMAVASAGAAVVAGEQLGRAITVAVPAAAIDPIARWGAAIVACVTVSLGFDRWTRGRAYFP
jgi:hypothetical protein